MSPPSVPIETLLAHGAWLRELARSLVRDENRADDLEQEAWLAALERPPRHEASPRGWLATVLRRAAGRAWKSETRREVRERAVARPEPLPPAGDLAARTEILERLVRAVMDLEEPYRGAVLLRYFEGLDPGEIARRSGTPVETVRTRLRRALERLRGRFDREHEGGRHAWTALLLPVAAFPEGPVAPPAGGAAAAGLVGGLLMGVKAKAATTAAVFLVLLLLGAGWAWRALAPESDSAGGAPVADAPPAGASGRSLREFFHGPSEPARPTQPPTPPAPAGGAAGTTGPESSRVRLRLLDPQGNPLVAEAARELLGRGAVVLLVRAAPLEGLRMEDHLMTQGITDGLYARAGVLWDSNGPYLADDVPAGAWRVLVAPEGGVPALGPEIRTAGGGEIDAAIRTVVPGGSRRVRLVAAEDRAPLAGAIATPWFEFRDRGAYLPGAPLVADADGEVALPLAAPVPGQRPSAWWVEAEGRAALLTPPADATAVPWEFRVPRTATVKGNAWLSTGVAATGRTVRSARNGRVVKAEVGASGEYVLEGVAADSSQPVFLLLVETVEPLKGATERVKVAPGAVVTVDLGKPQAAEPGAILKGRITVAGRLLAGVLVHTAPAKGAGTGGFTDEAGRFLIQGVEPGATGVLVQGGGGRGGFEIRTERALDVVAGEERDLSFDLPAGVLRVRAVDAATGAPIAGAAARAGAMEDASVRDRFPGWTFRAGWEGTTDAEGRVVLPGLPVGIRHRVVATAAGFEASEVETVVTGTAEAVQELELRLAPKP